MELIYTNEKIEAALGRLIRNYSEIHFAVAWASSGNLIYELLCNNCSAIKQGVIGTHFYQTHPDVLDQFCCSESVRFVLQPGGVFHPKLYLFRDKERWAVLIGSANLTTAAFKANSETMLLVEGTMDGSESLPDEVEELIERYWRTAETINDQEAKIYRVVWNHKQSSLNRICGKYGANLAFRPLTSSLIMSMTWEQFFDAVSKMTHHDFEQALDFLDKARNAFKQHLSFDSIDQPLRKTIAGLPNSEDGRWGWFGSMGGAGFYHQAVNQNNIHLSQALDCIPFQGIVSRNDYDGYISRFIEAFPNGGDGVAVASRLLAMKRSDQFVCLNSSNRIRLCEDFGINANGITYERYWEEIIERILDTPWWNAKPPAEEKERLVWDGRAAMLDAIFFEH